ncbi:acetoin dehydrogenase dihydrolipoyllysine-residue acetyltransferase subunit [Palleronia sp. KMU-117]|uniref:acetoin dehydrogenase dihydrolipoyllysine-residue acetyltransferase subunit n=1 Tax=Palleronia sp. KMU-117 TaxID=3434108 RepID=UPI003D72B5E7
MATPIKVDSAGGEYMETVVVLEWAASIGEPVREGDLLVTVETAKAATEVEAPVSGFLTAIFAESGTEVPLSAIMGLIGATADDTEHDLAIVADLSPTEGVAEAATDPLSAAPSPGVRIVASPAARQRARTLGIDLRTVRSSSPSGRIKLRDLGQTTTPSALPEPAMPGLRPDETGSLRIYRSGVEAGTSVLMLHGFGADAQSWHVLERDLARSHPVIRIDLPNHGRSPRRRTPGFPALAREIVDAVDALHLDRFHLVGHSLGGAVSLALADIRPRRVASLALLAPGGLGAEINGAFVAGLAKASRPESLGPWLRVMVSDPRTISDDFVAAAMTGRDQALRAAQMQMANDLFPDGTQGFDLRAALDRLDCPTRLIWGRADAVLPWQQVLCAPGRIGLHLFERTGHVPHFERPEDVLRILRAQIAEVAA